MVNYIDPRPSVRMGSATSLLSRVRNVVLLQMPAAERRHELQAPPDGLASIAPRDAQAGIGVCC
jgi:hypothetical protein